MQAMQQSSSQQYAIEKRAKAAETELQNVRAEFEQHKARAKKILSDVRKKNSSSCWLKAPFLGWGGGV